MTVYDVGIIGGGPAGLTAASTLARQLHTAVVFDSNKYRNEKATAMHMVPGLEGKDPAVFRRESREAILANYSTIEFQDVQVKTIVKKNASVFTLKDSNDKKWKVHKIILAVGSSDILPTIEGFDQLWGERIFHCLFCKGYEDKGAASAGVLAVAPMPLPSEVMIGLAVHSAQSASQLSQRVKLYTHGNEKLANELKSSIKAKAEWTVESREIKRLTKTENDSVLVEFLDGTSAEERFLVNQPLSVSGGPFVKQLGLATSSLGDIQAEAPFHQTSVRGVFAAGDCITPYKVIPSAISSGCNAAVGASTQLLAGRHGFPSVV